MKTYRVVFHDIRRNDTYVKMILNEEQKKVIEYLYDRQCFDETLKLQIASDEDWERFC